MKAQNRNASELGGLMDALSNYIIDLILENPKKYLLKAPKKEGTLKKAWQNKNTTL